MVTYNLCDCRLSLFRNSASAGYGRDGGNHIPKMPVKMMRPSQYLLEYDSCQTIVFYLQILVKLATCQYVFMLFDKLVISILSPQKSYFNTFAVVGSNHVYAPTARLRQYGSRSTICLFSCCKAIEVNGKFFMFIENCVSVRLHLPYFVLKASQLPAM